jgi:ribosomal protein S18 acetylase RimI-like enzyme
MSCRRIFQADLDNIEVLAKGTRLTEPFRQGLEEGESILLGCPDDAKLTALSGISYLRFDTHHFGFKAGTLLNPVALAGTSSNRDRELLDTLLLHAAGNGYRHITAKIPSEDIPLAGLLEDLGFRLITCNALLSQQLREKENDTGAPRIRRAAAADLQPLKSLARSGFSKGTRFHLDPRVPRDKATDLHVLWIENLLKDGHAQVLCADTGSGVAGFVACETRRETGATEERTGYITLIAVDPDYRGRGVGSDLVRAALGYFGKRVATVTVDTESLNYAALGLYQRNGFSIKGSRYVFHKWLGEERHG